jgi:hypothetical protein
MNPTDIVNDLIRRADAAGQKIGLVRSKIDIGFDGADYSILRRHIHDLTKKAIDMLVFNRIAISRAFHDVNRSQWWYKTEETKKKPKDPITWDEARLRELDRNMSYLERLVRHLDQEVVVTATFASPNRKPEGARHDVRPA